MFHRMILIGLALAAGMVSSPAAGGPPTSAVGEVLYNGIELPDQWPPANRDPTSLEPMEVPYLKNIPKVIPIDIGRQLFVDDFLIEQTDLRRVFHAAEKYSGNPVLVPTTEAELAIREKKDSGISGTVCAFNHGGAFFDPADGYMKFWYRGGSHFAMARSKDAIHWERVPDAVVKPVDAPGVNDHSFWLDTEAANPAERLKLLMKTGDNGQGHKFWTSPDGKTWSNAVRAEVTLQTKASDYCSFFYNPFRGLWIYSIKESIPVRARVRRYAEAKEFATVGIFDSSVFWVAADKLDLPDPAVGDAAQIYSLNAVAYESLMLGVFFVHVGPHNRMCLAGQFPKLTDLKLGFSRDGFHWDRPDHTPFIAGTRKEGTWDRAYLHSPPGGCFVVGDSLVFPYSGYSGVTSDGRRGMYAGSSIGLAVLRRDGFASVEAGATGGTLTTRPLKFSGKHLFVNVDCPSGELRVEVLDEAGNVVAPFSAANCVSIGADKTFQAVQWTGAADLAALADKPVRFRFSLRNGSLYAFWVSPDASGASNGFVAGGGPGYTSSRDTVGVAAYSAAVAAAAQP